MKKFIAYYRVSTDRQGQSGLGLDAQKSAVAAFLKGRGTLIDEYTEIESGRRNDRPELTAALAAAKKEKCTLVIAKLDRLARNVYFISGLLESAVDFIAVDMPEANKLTIHILAAVAEHEREMISKRTKEALAAAKKRGVKLGSPNPEKGSKIGIQINQERAERFAQAIEPHFQKLRAKGASYRQIANWLNAHGIQTRRGCHWKPTTVKRVLERVS